MPLSHFKRWIHHDAPHTRAAVLSVDNVDGIAAAAEGKQGTDTEHNGTMRTRVHGIRFTDKDWQKICDLADEKGTTPNILVNYIVGQYTSKDWDGLKPYGWNRHSEENVNNPEPLTIGGENA